MDWKSRAVCACVVLVATCSTARTEDVVSLATGMDAVKQIVAETEWQESLDVSPDQLKKLKKLLQKSAQNVRFNASSDGGPDADFEVLSNNLKVKDAAYASEIKEILAPEQLDARRVLYLKKRYKLPLDALDSKLLQRVGVTNEEIEKLQIANTVISVRREMDSVRSKEIGIILNAVPEMRKGFIEVFGTSLIPSTIPRDTSIKSSSFGIVPDDDPTLLLNSALVVSMPSGVSEVTQGQKRMLDALTQKIILLQVKDANFTPSKMALEGAKAILKEEQLKAVIERHHTIALRRNLSVTASPSVLKYFELNQEMAEKVRELSFNGQANIQRTQLKAEVSAWNSVLDKLNPEARSTLSTLFRKVWDSP